MGIMDLMAGAASYALRPKNSANAAKVGEGGGRCVFFSFFLFCFFYPDDERAKQNKKNSRDFP